MKRIGLTGGIGSGKSTIAKMFVELGATLIDADAISRQLMEPGEEVLAGTVKVFGTEILHEDGSLNRGQLAALVFADDSAREKLNAIIHPAIRTRSAQLVEDAQKRADFSGVILEDIPLLVETGQVERFDAVVVVYADMQVRLERLTGARDMNKADALSRIKAQASDEERACIATWIIDNSGTLEETKAQVEKIWSLIQSLEQGGK